MKVNVALAVTFSFTMKNSNHDTRSFVISSCEELTKLLFPKEKGGHNPYSLSYPSIAFSQG